VVLLYRARTGDPFLDHPEQFGQRSPTRGRAVRSESSPIQHQQEERRDLHLRRLGLQDETQARNPQRFGASSTTVIALVYCFVVVVFLLREYCVGSAQHPAMGEDGRDG